MTNNNCMLYDHKKNIKAIADMFSGFNIGVEFDNCVNDENTVKYCFSLKKPLPTKKILMYKDDLVIRLGYPEGLDILVEQTKAINRFEILLNNKVMENSRIEIGKFNFRNTLVIGNNDVERVNIIRQFVENGYDCYVISDMPKNYSEIIAPNRVFLPKDASAIFQFLETVIDKRCVNTAGQNCKKIQEDIDNPSSIEKNLIIIDSIDSLSPFAGEIERYFIPLLQKGYAARMCCVICVDRIINSYFIQAIVANCPNKIELQDAAVSLSSDDEDYYTFIEAVIHVVKKGEVSISLLQRWMALSYNRAKKYIDKMIGLGLVAYGEGDLRPKVIVTNEDEALDIIHKHAKGKKEIENT